MPKEIENRPWPFDQPRNCAAITVRQVLEDGEPGR